jgi:hypothetical protein
VLGPEHPDTLISMANLASTYRNQGRWTQAEELDVQVMETRQRALRPEHPDTLTSIVKLASTYQKQGRWTQAEELFVQVMETRKRVLEHEHPSTLTSMANLASTYASIRGMMADERLQLDIALQQMPLLVRPGHSPAMWNQDLLFDKPEPLPVVYRERSSNIQRNIP